MIAFAEPVADASQTAELLIGRPYLSWSAVSTYLKCPLKFQFHYLDQFPEEFVSSNLIFGAAIHSALEAYFNEHLASGSVLGVERLLEVYHEEWSRADLAAVQFGKSEDLASLGSLAERMLQAFVASDLVTSCRFHHRDRRGTSVFGDSRLPRLAGPPRSDGRDRRGGGGNRLQDGAEPLVSRRCQRG